MVSRALRAISKATCGWLTHGRFLFFARAKKRNQKKARPGARAGFAGSLRSSPHRALANSPGAHHAPRAQTRARLKAPGGAAVLGARYGDLKTPTEPWFFPIPYGAPEHRKPRAERPQGRARDRARSPSAQGCAVGRPPCPRREAQGDVAPSGRPFLSSISFGRTKEMDPGCRGGATRNY